MFQEKTVDLDSVKLNYAEGPTSGPPVVFLHGIQANWNSLMPLIFGLIAQLAFYKPPHYPTVLAATRAI